MTKAQLYDTIGVGYANARKPDPRIHAQVLDALGNAKTVVNVGAGTGNYEPDDREVVAVEPNSVMLAQRTSSAPAVQAQAEALPMRDQSFDASLAMFTIHHWPDRVRGLIEFGRVSRRQVALVYDQAVTNTFWLGEFFPDIINNNAATPHPSPALMGEHLNLIDERIMWVPDECTDGFAGCYWNRPERYLDPVVQAGMSVLARLSSDALAIGSARLKRAIESGDWDARYGDLRDQSQFDVGYRLAICEWPA